MTSASLPLYMQIADSLLEGIEQGAPAPGERLPSERQLAVDFAVNRRTVRRALEVLDRRGLIERHQGAGTLVASPRLQRAAAEFFPFTEGVRHRGSEPGSKILSLERVPATPNVATRLGLQFSAEVYHFRRLRSIDGQPTLIETFSLPAHLVPGIDAYDFGVRSVYDIMENEYGVVVERAQLSLEAVAMSELEARWLQVPVGWPAMLERHLAFDDQGRPVDSGFDVYRGDRVRFVTDSATLPVDIAEYDRTRMGDVRW